MYRLVIVCSLLAAALGIFLVGCATAPYSSPAPSQSALLSQAGFRTHTATSPETQASIKTLPPSKVVLNRYQDKPLYLVCTEPGARQCFIGDEAAYQRYQQLAIQHRLSEDQHKVQERRDDPEWWPMYMDSQGGG
jgi:hypothetical protein